MTQDRLDEIRGDLKNVYDLLYSIPAKYEDAEANAAYATVELALDAILHKLT